MMKGRRDLVFSKSDAPETDSRIVGAMLIVQSISFGVATRAVLLYGQMIG